MDSDKFFKTRRTVRAYSAGAISDDEIMEMIDAASHAPNTGNMQWYSVVVTRDAETKRLLSPQHFGQPQVEQAAAVLTFCIDLCRFEKWCRISHAEPGFDNFQSFIAAIIDTSLVAQQFCTIAEMRGYGTCYLGTTTYNAPQIAEILGLPDRVVPVTTLTVGICADDAPSGPTWRLPVEAITHFERYSEPSERLVAEWYNPLEAESARFVKENSKENLAQVFTDIRYPRESAERFSEVYYKFLEKNKFL